MMTFCGCISSIDWVAKLLKCESVQLFAWFDIAIARRDVVV